MPDDLDLQTTYHAIVAAAKKREFLTYKDVVDANGADWSWPKNPVFGHLGELSKLSVENLKGPMLSAIVVSVQDIDTGGMSESSLKGFIGAAKEIEWPTGCSPDLNDPGTHRPFMRAQQEAVFEWAPNAPDNPDFSSVESSAERPLDEYRFYGYILDALRDLGGEAETKAVIEKVKKLDDPTEQELEHTYKSGQTKYYNCINFARLTLVKAKYIDGSDYGWWKLTSEGRAAYLNRESARQLHRQVYSKKSHDPVKPQPPVRPRRPANINPDNKPEGENPFINDIVKDGCFLDKTKLKDILIRLKDKKNLILQGPPGTGKTWLAKRLGYALIEKGEKSARKHMHVVQFHPSMSYEDFVEGWRPSENMGLSRTPGVFLEAIKAARSKELEERPFVFVIEEINRGNPAQIFGEMLTLLEADKRGPDEAIKLTYSSDPQYIPRNFFVIGTMNTADRSLALVDYALRRRFAFVSLKPEFNDEWWKWCEQATIDHDMISKIQTRMVSLNLIIEKDDSLSLGPQFGIGHSFVTPPAQPEMQGVPVEIRDARRWFRQIVNTEINPLLKEYWFDYPEKAEEETEKLLKDI